MEPDAVAELFPMVKTGSEMYDGYLYLFLNEGFSVPDAIKQTDALVAECARHPAPTAEDVDRIRESGCMLLMKQPRCDQLVFSDDGNPIILQKGPFLQSGSESCIRQLQIVSEVLYSMRITPVELKIVIDCHFGASLWNATLPVGFFRFLSHFPSNTRVIVCGADPRLSATCTKALEYLPERTASRVVVCSDYAAAREAVPSRWWLPHWGDGGAYQFDLDEYKEWLRGILRSTPRTTLWKGAA